MHDVPSWLQIVPTPKTGKKNTKTMDILFLILGLALILGGANFLTDGSAALAQRFKVSEFIIGLTVVAVGTSTPELVVSLLSAINGQSDMAIGNVVGSNTFNVFMTLGVCAVVAPLALTRSNIRRDIPIGFAVSLILLACGYSGVISRPVGVVFVILYMLLMWYTIRSSKPEAGDAPDAPSTEKPKSMWLTLLMIVGGLAALVGGGNLFLDSATAIARTLGVSELVIAITLVAGGTSLPELASSIVSLVKGKADMALGNVIGSNTANILLILGTSASVTPLTLGSITIIDLYMVLLSSLVLFIAAFTFRKKAIDRWEGIIFLLIYVAYIYYLITR